MNVFAFLFYSLLIVLVHGQGVPDRYRRWRQRVYQIQQMASVIRNIRGQAAINRQRNIRPLPRHIQQMASSAVHDANLQGQSSTSPSPSDNSRPRAFSLQQVVHAAIHNASLSQAAPANRIQDAPQAQEIDRMVANAIQNASIQAQQAPVNRSQNGRQRAHEIHQNASSESADEEDSQPQSWRDLLTRNNVTNVHDFVRLLRRDGQPVNEEELFQRSESGKIVIAGSGDLLAVSDECSPRNTTVKLKMEEEDPDPNVVFYPECTRIERCGGCTPAPYLACTPVYKEIVVLTVLKATYPYPGAVSMDIQGFAPVRVERHISCRATCTLKQDDCGPNSRFIWDLCRCQCNSYTPCTNGKVWDEFTCACKCPQVEACCQQEEDERQCPRFFDHDFCECTLKESVGAQSNASQAEMEAWIASRRNRRPDLFLVTNPNASNTTATTPPTITPPTTTPTTPTTPSPTTQPDCSRMSCPRNLVKVMSPSGRCVCQHRGRG